MSAERQFARAIAFQSIGKAKVNGKTMKFYQGEFGDFQVILDHKGYINATKLVATCEKRYENWVRNKIADELFQACESSAGIPKNELSYLVKGGKIPEIRGTYIHPMLITALAQWLSPEMGAAVSLWIEEWKEIDDNKDRYFGKLATMKPYNCGGDEDSVQKFLAEKLEGEREVQCEMGYIDILTDTCLIEVKNVSNWMTAVGQLLVYGHDYPDHKLVMYLFGDVDDETVIDKIRLHCDKLHIHVAVYPEAIFI